MENGKFTVVWRDLSRQRCVFCPRSEEVLKWEVYGKEKKRKKERVSHARYIYIYMLERHDTLEAVSSASSVDTT